jgi:hypothetical protein
MDIKMPIKFHGNYLVMIRSGSEEMRERCQKLTVRALSEQEKAGAYPDLPETERPSHQVTFYDFGCKRIIEGRIRINEENRLVLEVKEKEYEFAPFVPKH